MIDRGLIEKLYRERYQDLVTFATLRIKNPDRAEEIVQEAFLWALQPLRKEPKNVKGFYTYMRAKVRTLVWEANRVDEREIRLETHN